MFPPLRQIAPQFAGRHFPFILRQTQDERKNAAKAARNFLTVHSGLILCALFLLVGLATAGDYGLSHDEYVQIEIATVNLNYILGQTDSFDRTSHALYGAVFELPLLLADRALGLTEPHYSHRLRTTLTHLFFIVGGFFCYRLAYQLFNNRLLALFALLLYLLHPRIYAQSFFNSKDPVFFSMFVIALYLLERAFRRGSVGDFILLGVAVGVLTNIRIMGLMLFPAIIAMRGLDLCQAGNWPQRRGLLLTGGMFALAAGLTLYAVTPYAWTHPLEYLTGNLDRAVNLQTNWPLRLFQGEWFPADQLPRRYNAVWFGVTTPPLILLLGGVGAAVVAAGGIRRPRAVFRNTRQRFHLALLACFLLPPLAAALLGANQYRDWQHLYFIYAPFGLLAAGGLHWLAAAGTHRRMGAAAACGLTAVGLGLALLQMTQLHPLQNFYFNFLVDRATPEQLRSQYHFSYLELGRYAALRQLLERNPGATLTVRAYRGRGEGTEWDILPAADRERLPPPGAAGRADYELIHPLSPSQPDLSFNSAYRRLYNSTVTALRPLDASRMTPAASAAYREIYRQAIAGEPIIRADYKVYRNGQRLTFLQENCPPDSRDAWFGVELFPPDRERRRPEPGFYISPGRLPASVNNHRVQLGALCLAVIQLPDYFRGDVIVSRRHLGPLQPADLVWAELYSLDPPGIRERIDQLRLEQPAAEADDFAVFLEPEAGGGYHLLYAKGDCSREEYETGVFLHIHPDNLGDLPFYLWPSGVDNREFSLPRYGARPAGECLAVFPLPDYPIARLLTGQAGLWERKLYPPADPERLRAVYAALAGIQPAARAAFDLYIQDNRLIYLRETCNAADTAAGFFLHIIPENTADLPPERQAAGFANRDFAFDHWGGPFDGKCLAAVPLPDYPVKSVRTGQFQTGQGELWAAELTAGW